MDYETAKIKVRHLKSIINDPAAESGERFAAKQAYNKLVFQFDIKSESENMPQPKKLSDRHILEIRKLFPNYSFDHYIPEDLSEIQFKFKSTKNNFAETFNDEGKEKLKKVLRAKYFDMEEPSQMGKTAITTMQKQRQNFKTWNVIVVIKDFDISE